MNKLNYIAIAFSALLLFQNCSSYHTIALKEEGNVSNRIVEGKAYTVVVKLMDNSKKKGILYSADEEEITLHNTDWPLVSVPVSSIQMMFIGKKNLVGSSTIIGGLSGLLVGGLIGLAQGDDDTWFFNLTKEENALIGALIGLPVGAGVGALFGTTKKKIVINGNLQIYKTNLASLRNYSLAPSSLE